jgi:hypothetical protein
MQWFYAQNGQQAGPVSEAQLDELARNGTITAATLVWRDGLANWQAYSVARPGASAPPPLAGALPMSFDQAPCVECRRVFSKNDLLAYENVFVCGECKPVFFQKLREGVVPGASALWRTGKFLVMRRDAVLPNRCVKCNADAPMEKLRRKLFWHHPLIYLLIPAGLLFYAIIATIVGKRARIEIGLCPEHRRKRKRDLLIAWLLFVSSIGSFVAAGVFSSGWPVLAGFLCLIASPVYGSITCAMVAPKRIDDQFIWLKGVSPQFLAPLGEFPRQP